MKRSVKVFLSFFFSVLPILGKGGCSCLLFCKARIRANALSSFSWVSEMSFWCPFEPQASFFTTPSGKISEIKALTWSFCSPNYERGDERKSFLTKSPNCSVMTIFLEVLWLYCWGYQVGMHLYPLYSIHLYKSLKVDDDYLRLWSTSSGRWGGGQVVPAENYPNTKNQGLEQREWVVHPQVDGERSVYSSHRPPHSHPPERGKKNWK